MPAPPEPPAIDLAELLIEASVPEDGPSRVRRTARRRRRQRSVGGAVISAVALAAGGALLARALEPSTTTVAGPRPTSRQPGSTAQPAGSWERLPKSPLSPRQRALAFWTGSRVVIIGGNNAPPCPPGADCLRSGTPLRDGAMFDLSTGRWQRIADAPRPVEAATGTVLGDTVYLWLRELDAQNAERQVLLAYDSGDDRWAELAPPSSPFPFPRRLLTAGERVVAYLPTHEHGYYPDLVFDLRTRSWSELPADPLRPSFDRSMVWTGRELVLLGIAHTSSPGAEQPSHYGATVLDLAKSTWRRLPDSQITAYNPDWFWSSGRVVNPTLGGANGGRNIEGRSIPRGGLLDPTTGTWSLLPETPKGLGGVTGLSLGGGDHVVNLEGWVLNVATSKWTALPEYSGEAVSRQAAVWAGDRLVVFGGSKWSGTEGLLLDDAWAWRPS